jgi:hypothetical protein
MRVLGGLVAALMLCSCKSPIKPRADGTCPEGWYLNSDHNGEWGSNTQTGDGEYVLAGTASTALSLTRGLPG